MITSELKKYAFALFEVAKKENELSNMHESMNMFATEFLKAKPLLQKLHLESLDKQKQIEALSIILQNVKAHTLLINFVHTLIDRNKINLLENFLQSYNELQKEFEGYEKIEVITSEPLLEDQEKAINLQLEKVLGNKFFIEKKIDENIIAGLIVRGKDFEFNDSILGKLNSISKNIKGALFNE